MAPLSETSATAEEAEQQKCTNRSVPCVQGDTDPGLFNLWVGQRPEEGSGEPTGPCCSSGTRAVGGLLPGAGLGALGVGSRRSPLVVLCAGTPLPHPAPQKRQLHCGLSVSRG